MAHGLCPRCGGSKKRWTGVRLVWCSCSGLWGAAPDPANDGRESYISVERWPAVAERLRRVR